MESHFIAPVKRPQNRSQARSRMERNSEDVRIRLATVPESETTNLPSDYYRDLGSSSQPMEPAAPGEEPKRRLCDDSVESLNKLIHENESIVRSTDNIVQALEKEITILPSITTLLEDLQATIAGIEGGLPTNAESENQTERQEDLIVVIITLHRFVNGL